VGEPTPREPIDTDQRQGAVDGRTNAKEPLSWANQRQGNPSIRISAKAPSMGGVLRYFYSMNENGNDAYQPLSKRGIAKLIG
jgi:hypothetical protein